MKAMETLREKLADEILSTIADYHSADKLCEEFEKRVGVKLGREFVKFSPVLSTARFVRSPIGTNPQEEIVYTTNFSHELSQCNRRYDKQHREMLLIQVYKLVNEGVNQFCESTGNSALHYLVTLPGSTTPNLVRLLLGAGANPLQKNENGQNILHMIVGRMRAQKDDDGNLVIDNEITDTTDRWQSRRELSADDQVAILNVLKEELPVTELTVLVKEQDENGNTAMHEWAFTASLPDSSSSREMEVASLLLGFGGLLCLPNNSGHIPLHYAFSVGVFKFLVEHEDLCHVKNYFDETPIMFMIKTIVRQVFEKTYIAKYPELETVFIEVANAKPVRIDVGKLSHILEIVQATEEVRHTIWTPDFFRNAIFDIVLNSIKVASWFDFNHSRVKNLGIVKGLLKLRSIATLRKNLIPLLDEIMSIDATANELKRPDNGNQNPLHTLLALQPLVYFFQCYDSAILESLEILLHGGVEVNAVDKDGLNPLDIAYQYFSHQPSLYKEVIAKLLEHGAVRSIPQSFKREVKSSCPKRHRINARNLAKAKSTEEKVTVVGKYRYFSDQPIGTGAFSSVFLAIKDELHGEQSDTVYCSAFALKRIEKAKVNPKEISNEVKAFISLSNKCEHIVKYYGDELSDDAFFLYLCLELMDGDLEHAVTNNPQILTKVNQMKAVQEIICGVAYLHQHGFIHRDLKPTNILYTTEPSLHFKIGDFGLAKNLSSFSTMTSTVGSGVAKAPGTRCWMAPELVSMQSREHTKHSDIFSLGLVLHYLVTLGNHPFASRSEEPPYVIERRIAEMQINIDRALHPETANLLQRLLARIPQKRLPAEYINQHPFLWGDRKKIEFLKAVGDQPEAAKPANNANSALEIRLQKTTVGKRVELLPWDQGINVKKLFKEMVKARKQKKYRTDKVIDLLRFIRNAYAHQQERSLEVQEVLQSNIFLVAYPTLVLDVFMVVQDLGFLSRTNIRKVLEVLAADPQ